MTTAEPNTMSAKAQPNTQSQAQARMARIHEEVAAALADRIDYPYGEPDPLRWAIAFSQIATRNNPLGRALRQFPHDGSQEQLSAILLGWFSNAMATAKAHPRD